MTIIHNRHHYSGAILARIAVNVATLLWSTVVLIYDDALVLTTYFRYLPPYIHEDVWAWFFLALSGFMLYRIVRQHKPNPVGIIGYGILGAAWVFIDAAMLVQSPINPDAAWVTVGAALAVYGFVANPRTCHVATG